MGTVPRHQAHRNFPATRLRRSALRHPSRTGAQHAFTEPGAGIFARRPLPGSAERDQAGGMFALVRTSVTASPSAAPGLTSPDATDELAERSTCGQPPPLPGRFAASGPGDGSRRCDLVTSVLTVTSGFMSCGTRVEARVPQLSGRLVT